MKKSFFTKTIWCLWVIPLLLMQSMAGHAQIINTVVGGASGGVALGDAGQADSAIIGGAFWVAFDGAGNMYIADYNNNVIRKVNSAGIISTVVGNYTQGYSGDNGPATAAQLSNPCCIAFDNAGNMYIAEYGNNCIRKVDAAGIITTVAGTSTAGYNGDGIAATAAHLNSPYGVAFDAAGNMYIADYFNYRIRKVDASGTISTIAGIGTDGFSGDGGPATAAQVAPDGVTINAGNIYIADIDNSNIRVITPDGKINTVAGNNTAGYSGDGGLATAAALQYPYSVTFDAAGNMYITDGSNYSIRKVDAVSGVITTVAGNGQYDAYNGDNIAATTATLTPINVAFNATGNMYIADYGHSRVRKVDAAGIITTVAGTGAVDDYAVTLDGNAATTALLNNPTDIAFDNTGNMYIADATHNRIRKVDATTGIISTIAGTGVGGYNGDTILAATAQLNNPGFVAFDAVGNLYIGDCGNLRIRKINTAGIISTVAGVGTTGYDDGIPATTARLYSVSGMALDASGNIYVAEDGIGERIRKIDVVSGIISTVAGVYPATAGHPNMGYNGDNIPATTALLNIPSGICIDPSGNLYIADEGNNRIRKVNISGIISTIAGTGTPTYYGDGGPATVAQLNDAGSLGIDAAGNIYIGDGANYRVRKIDAVSDTINTVVGSGIRGFSGDGGLATKAQISTTSKATFDAAGNMYIADAGNNCVREVLKPCSSVAAGSISHTGSDTLCVSGSSTLNLLGASAPATFFGTTIKDTSSISYQWQSFTNETGWRNVGTDTSSYNTGNITSTTIYRVVVTCKAASISDTTDSDTLVVKTALTPTVNIAANTGTSICPNTNVIFTATPTNGGSNPTYQWTKNGVIINNNSSNTYTDNSLNNNDSIVCTLTTSTGACVNTTTATSNTLKMSVTGAVNPTVSISADKGTSVCNGVPVTYTASPTGGGASPTYQWIKNGAVVGSITGDTYIDNSVTNNDSIRSILTSSATCASPATANSNSLIMTVTPTVLPTISIIANQGNTACSGIPVNFTATVGNEGSSPIYKWTVNGNVSGTGNTYSSSVLNTNDKVVCTLISSATCASPDTVQSSAITMTVNQSVTPGISISTTSTNISAGTIVVFTATTTNGGSNTTYQWRINGINVPGATGSTYVTDSLVDANSVTCMIHSDAVCATPDSATSNALVIHVSTGIHSVNSGLEGLVLSPNPNKGTFSITGTVNDSKEVTIEILDMIGQIIYQDKVAVAHNQLQKQISLPVTNVNGVYLLRLKTDNGTSVKRFVIER